MAALFLKEPFAAAFGKKTFPPKKKQKQVPKNNRWVQSGPVVWVGKQQHRPTPWGRWCHPGPEGAAPSFFVDQQGLTFREGWTWQFAHRRPGGFDLKGVEVMDGWSKSKEWFILKWGQSLKKRKEIPNLETRSSFSGSSRSNFGGCKSKLRFCF